MYPFWDRVVWPVVQATRARRIVEIGALRDVERTSIDYYASVRSIYLQKHSIDSDNGDVAPDPPKP